MIKLPGLIDAHVHPRGLPTDSYKEDFYTVTQAAVAGGFTTILDMPNNPKTPTLTLNLLREKQKIAEKKIICDVGFIFGTNGQNLSEFKKVAKYVFGLKVFLSFSTGNLIVNPKTLKQIAKIWPIPPIGGPILLHAENSDTIQKALSILKNSKHQIHICHISSKDELEQIIKARNEGINVTCGVTPHHLFLTDQDAKKLGPIGMVKPSLKSQDDVNFLWHHLKDIDIIESDHAPHSKEEKLSNNPPFGITNLETTLALLLTAMKDKRISLEEIIDKCFTKPKEIFSITTDNDTFIEIDENKKWVVDENKLFTKAKFTPYNNWQLTGKVEKVFIRGKKVFEKGEILTKEGSGKILKNIL